jgi:hypothetical protein
MIPAISNGPFGKKAVCLLFVLKLCHATFEIFPFRAVIRPMATQRVRLILSWYPILN